MHYDLEKPVDNKKPASRQVTIGEVMREVVRLYHYQTLLGSRRFVSAQDLMTTLEAAAKYV